jgi:hypothetical protein
MKKHEPFATTLHTEIGTSLANQQLVKIASDDAVPRSDIKEERQPKASAGDSREVG